MSPADAQRFESTEPYYAEYRPGYGEAAIQYLVDRFELDGSSRVLDLGCGTGQIALPLAAHAGEVVGMDPNEDMLEFARRRAAEAGRENVEWVVGSDADLREGLGPFRLVTMGRSFHWMDQERTLTRIRRLTEPDGGVAILTDEEWLTRGDREWQDDVYAVASDYLDDLPERTGPVEEYEEPWDELIQEHGFTDVEVTTFEVRREWTIDRIVGYVFSLSFCSPAVFGERRTEFEADLRASLQESNREPFTQEATVEIISGRT